MSDMDNRSFIIGALFTALSSKLLKAELGNDAFLRFLLDYELQNKHELDILTDAEWDVIGTWTRQIFLNTQKFLKKMGYNTDYLDPENNKKGVYG